MKCRGLFSVPPERENLNSSNEIERSSRISFDVRISFSSSSSGNLIHVSNSSLRCPKSQWDDQTHRVSQPSIIVFNLNLHTSHEKLPPARKRTRRRRRSSSSFQIQRIRKRERKRGREDVQWEQVLREAARDLRSGLRKMTVSSLGKFEDNPLARLSVDQKRRSWSLCGYREEARSYTLSLKSTGRLFISADIFHWDADFFYFFLIINFLESQD